MPLVKIDFANKTKADADEINANFVALLAINSYGEDLTALTDGIKVTFVGGVDFAALFKPGTIRIYKNGLRLRKGPTADYIETLDGNGDGLSFTLAVAPPTSTPLLIDYQKANV
jgi:hypothetical protein